MIGRRAFFKKINLVSFPPALFAEKEFQSKILSISTQNKDNLEVIQKMRTLQFQFLIFDTHSVFIFVSHYSDIFHLHFLPPTKKTLGFSSLTYFIGNNLNDRIVCIVTDRCSADRFSLYEETWAVHFNE